MRKGLLVLLAVLVCITIPITCVAAGPLADTLAQHANTFIANNYAGQMSATVTEYETISSTSNRTALADLLTLNWFVVDQNAGQFTAITGATEQRQAYIDSILSSKMIDGALVARVDWTWGNSTATEYALVSPDATVGDINAIQDGIAGWYRIADTTLLPAAQSVRYHYHDGFGFDSATFEASIECVNGVPVPHVLATTRNPGDSADYRKSVWKENHMCIMDIAFVGTTGFPSISFDANKFNFSVSGWGWTFHNSYDRLTVDCPPVPEPSALFALATGLCGAGGMVLRRRYRA